MEKRLLVAIVLSALVLFLYNLFYYKEVEKKQKLYKNSVKQEEILPAPPSKIVKEIPVGAWEREIPTLKIKEEKLILKTNVMKIKLNPKGKIDSWQLFNFKEKDKGLVELINLHGKPLTVLLGNKEFIPTDFATLNSGIKEFVYTNQAMPQITVIKQFSSYPDSYAIDVNIKVVNNSPTPLKEQDLTLQWDTPPNPRSGTASHSIILEQVCFSDGKKEKITHKAMGFLDGILSAIGLIPPVQPEDSVRVKEGKISWIAQDSQYFLNILLSNEFVEKAIFTKKIDGQQTMSLVISEINLLPNQTKSFKFKVYGGPKDMEILKSLTFGAEKLTGIDPLAGVIHFILKKLYELTHNYGISIILLTIIIKILLHPLTKKNFVVMKNMQKKMKMIQPELEKLKEKHKDDKESLNREMMELYKRAKVNPLGGCLPMLLQMPVFFALFTTLNKSIELRGASFLIWGDLSSKDPFYILPILMGATMFIQQKMTPTADPQQAKMGQMMTIVFTFMFINFPVGLVLYWTIQNILTIAEQCLINKGIEK
ncbi:MAG: membrane protein insertase YidC [Nitrospirota bacterium]